MVTYSHALEEPGNLEIAMKGLAASPAYGNSFGSSTLELEYGATAWWTTQVYLGGQTTSHDSTIYNGFRWGQRVQNAKDGEIFWLLRNGNLGKGMPSWSALPEPSRWQVITYVKSLGVTPHLAPRAGRPEDIFERGD